MSAEALVDTLRQWLDVSMRRSMREFIRYARQSGLSMSQFGALLHLHRAGVCGVTQIGDHLGVTGGAASQMIDRLVSQGLVLRDVDPQDRRVKRIELTDKGIRLIEEGLKARQSWLSDVSQALSEDERQEIISALKTLMDRLHALAAATQLEHA